MLYEICHMHILTYNAVYVDRKDLHFTLGSIIAQF